MTAFNAWVLRASATKFTAGCRTLLPDMPRFGDLIHVGQPENRLFGLIYDVRIRDDLTIRQLILADHLEAETVLDQQLNRLVPIEIGVLTVGYQVGEKMVHGIPPQPPLSLDLMALCNDVELRAFTGNLEYLSLILSAGQIPTDELVVAHLRRVAASHPPEHRHQFLIQVGQRLAQLLNSDLIRLDNILRRIGPAHFQ